MSEWLGDLEKDTEGVELSRLMAEYWHMGTMDGFELDEAVVAANAMGVSLDELFCGMAAANRERGIGTTNTESVMQNGFVPSENVADYQRTLDSVFGKGACKALKIRNQGAVKVI